MTTVLSIKSWGRGRAESSSVGTHRLSGFGWQRWPDPVLAPPPSGLCRFPRPLFHQDRRPQCRAGTEAGERGGGHLLTGNSHPCVLRLKLRISGFLGFCASVKLNCLTFTFSPFHDWQHGGLFAL